MTIVLSFVSMIVPCMEGKEAWVEEPGSMHGRRDMHGREKISVAIDGRMAERAYMAPLFYIYSYLYRQLDRSRWWSITL